jgi:hypothetical protein
MGIRIHRKDGIVLKASTYGIIALGVLHMLVLGVDALGHIPGWAAGKLWTWEHWEPVSGQRQDLVISGFAFWSTIGSFAIPLILLGLLVLWMIRRGVAVPRFVGFGLLGWGCIGTLIMLPSGFPIFSLVAVGFSLGLIRSASAA